MRIFGSKKSCAKTHGAKKYLSTAKEASEYALSFDTWVGPIRALVRVEKSPQSCLVPSKRARCATSYYERKAREGGVFGAEKVESGLDLEKIS